jgi:hypothetical protein
MSKQNRHKNLLGLSKNKVSPGGEEKKNNNANTARPSEPTLDAKQRWQGRRNKAKRVEM